MVDPHIKVNIPKISFRDVAGMKEAKQEVMEFVEYIKAPEKFAVGRYLKKIIRYKFFRHWERKFLKVLYFLVLLVLARLY